jgi:ribosomal protein S18 acetylase RimI-like enzyme
MWFVSISTRCLDQRRALEVLGFEDVSDMGEDSWSKVLFEFVDESRLPPIHLPDGLKIRSLDVNSEIQAYVDLHRAVFQSENMTCGWRTKATRMTGYINDLDIVLDSESGELCGFCVAWLRHQVSGECVGQIEPLGVRESHRGQRLSQALLAAAVHRLRRQGAHRIFVETDRQRPAAMGAYSSVGFRVTHEVLVYRHIVNGS